MVKVPLEARVKYFKKAKGGDTHYPAATLIKPFAEGATPPGVSRASSPPSEEEERVENAGKAKPGSGMRAEQGFIEGALSNLVNAGMSMQFFD